jgi:hypothetical protein
MGGHILYSDNNTVLNIIGQLANVSTILCYRRYRLSVFIELNHDLENVLQQLCSVFVRVP